MTDLFFMKPTVDVNDKFRQLSEAEEFKSWQKNNKGSYLVSVFFMSDSPEEVQFDFYNEKNDSITSFSVKKDSLEKIEGLEIVKNEKEPLKKLDLKNSWDFGKALEESFKFVINEYKDEPYKIIVALQNSNLGNVWNITIITKSFKVLNLRIGCDTNKILKYDMKNIFEFRK